MAPNIIIISEFQRI